MIKAILSYLGRHQVGLLALFVALGTGGAVAATTGSGGEIRGFSATPSNKNSTTHGTLVRLGAMTLKWQSVARPDERDCILVVSAKGRADIGGFVALHSSGQPQQYSVVGKTLSHGGSAAIARATFLPGAPNVTEQAVGGLTFHAGTSKEVVTAQYHMAALQNSCLFQGTSTAGS
jgi:hypothetical protein